MLNIKCYCNKGYFGLNCNKILSCGYCKNHQCNGNDECTSCPFGWQGKHCLKPKFEHRKMCLENSFNNLILANKGVIRDPGKCTCNPGWTGRYCTKITCDRTNYCQNNGIYR